MGPISKDNFDNYKKIIYLPNENKSSRKISNFITGMILR